MPRFAFVCEPETNDVAGRFISAFKDRPFKTRTLTSGPLCHPAAPIRVPGVKSLIGSYGDERHSGER